MESYRDYGTSFARTLVVKTSHRRESRGRKHNPWDKRPKRKMICSRIS